LVLEWLEKGRGRKRGRFLSDEQGKIELKGKESDGDKGKVKRD